MAKTRTRNAPAHDRMTVLCECGVRVRSEIRRLRTGPPCPKCRQPLPFRAEPKDERRLDDVCKCGIKSSFPRERAGLWVECPRCGDRRVLPGQRIDVKKALPIDLPPERESISKGAPKSGAGAWLLFFLLAAIAAGIAAWRLGYLSI